PGSRSAGRPRSRGRAHARSRRPGRAGTPAPPAGCRPHLPRPAGTAPPGSRARRGRRRRRRHRSDAHPGVAGPPPAPGQPRDGRCREQSWPTIELHAPARLAHPACAGAHVGPARRPVGPRPSLGTASPRFRPATAWVALWCHADRRVRQVRPGPAVRAFAGLRRAPGPRPRRCDQRARRERCRGRRRARGGGAGRGPRPHRGPWRRALQMGVDSGVHVCDERVAGADVVGTAKVLAAAIRTIERSGPIDLVVTGMATMDGLTSMLPAALAALLDRPALTLASRIGHLEGDALTITRSIGEAEEEQTACLPALVSVTDQLNEPRIPGAMSLMSARKKPVETWLLDDLDGGT